ncbi:MAG: asparagine synthase (glutamine-hydrolyzing) [Thermodesulfobacteriota bacterium]|nr:asparagine synthase (glutamine-hydrolyzing) [Thermodesulfobacteriota bacterium]
MCGIAGFIGIHEEGLIEKMLRATRHRGPDASGAWSDSSIPISLGHNRLSILDLSERGKQPMWDDTGRHCITYNGEIYNYRELRRFLESRGYRFRSDTDTEVLLYLFRDWGPACLRELQGIWAFAFWDTREEILYLSRDPLGVKPLYFVFQDNKFLFSSEIKSLLCWKGLSREVDEQALLETLIYLWTPGPRTILHRVRKLLPGQMLTVRAGEAPSITEEVDIKPRKDIAGTDETEILELVRSQLHRSVQSQLVSDVPVGAFLSGGLDSSAVVAIAEREGRRISHCYTINYADGRNWEGMVNDLDYARRVARQLGVPCLEIPLESTILERVREMIWHLDEPQADLAPLNVLLIAEAARQQGDYVLLSGAGGDDIFSGYRRHLALMTERWWDWMPSTLRTSVRLLSERVHSSNPSLRRFKRMFQYADRSREERLVHYFTWASKSYVLQLLQGDLSQRLADHDPLQVMREALGKHTCQMDNLNKMLFLDTRFFLTDHNLNYTDKMGMARGVEIRVPLIDIDLVRLAFAIPGRLKQRGFTGKYIFKRAMEPFLPKEVIYRPKTGFVAPVREWMLGPLHDQIRSVLSREAIQRRGWFSFPAIECLFQELRENRQDLHYLLLSVYMLEEWARLFLDGEGYPAH